MSTTSYLCPACGRLIERAIGLCPFCGADIPWVMEERRLAAEYLRYFSFATLGGALLSMAVLLLSGFVRKTVAQVLRG